MIMLVAIVPKIKKKQISREKDMLVEIDIVRSMNHSMIPSLKEYQCFLTFNTSTSSVSHSM
jgi:hypothetical protein